MADFMASPVASPVPSPAPSPSMHDMETLQIKIIILVSVVAVHAQMLMGLSSLRSSSGHPALRYFRWGLSAVYLPLMSYVLSYLTTNLRTLEAEDQMWLLLSVVLIQFLKAKADMAALAMTAVASPAAGDDDINSLRVRPSMESLVYNFWVAGLIIYNIFRCKNKVLIYISDDGIIILPLWVLGACRAVLTFVAFQRATGSFALGRNVQLIDGYMAQLQDNADCSEDGGELPVPATVPRLILTGERNQDVEETPLGYRVKRCALENNPSSLVTLDQVWSDSDSRLLSPSHKNLCLSFALFKCLRRRFAGYQMVEAGSSWALCFVRNGLLGRQDDHERIFRVISDELIFASDFYYSHLPLTSLGTLFAALHFFLSLLIFSWLLCMLLLIIPTEFRFLLVLSEYAASEKHPHILAPLPFVLTLVLACTEVSQIVAALRSNWTKISIIGHFIRHRSCWARRIFSCLLRWCKPQYKWKDEIGQIDLFHEFFVPRKNGHKPVIKVPSLAKAAILSTFRNNGGRLSNGMAAVQRRCQAFHDDITWACCDSSVRTTTDRVLVWCIATSLFETRFSSRRASSSTSDTNLLVACCLSRYCMYLVAEAPDLLPDNSTWSKHRYQEMKEKVKAAAPRDNCADPEEDEGDVVGRIYGLLIDSFSSESSHEILKNGSALGKQLVMEAERLQRSDGEGGATDGGEEAVWELLAEFWSEMLLYLAPSDNVKGHIEVLQRGGELITLLWVLLLHAGITSRPVHHVPEP